MSSQIAEIIGELNRLKKKVAEMPMLRARIIELERRPPVPGQVFPLPAKKGSTALRLITMARSNPEEAKAEAKRLAREDTASKRL